MKITGARAARFLDKPPEDTIGVLLFGPDRGLVRERAQALAKLFISNPDDAFAIEAGDMTPRSAIRKACEASGHFAAVGCYNDSAADVANMVRSGLSDKSISIEPAALSMWVPLLEGDRGLIRNEIEKMALYKGYGQVAGESVTVEDVKVLAAGGQAAAKQTCQRRVR